MRLEEVVIDNYRSCRSVRFAPRSRLSVLIGPNGSGKTNLLRGICLLRRLAQEVRGSADGGFSDERCRIRASFQKGSERISYLAAIRYGVDLEGDERIHSTREQWKFPDDPKSAGQYLMPMARMNPGFHYPYFPYRSHAGLTSMRRYQRAMSRGWVYPSIRSHDRKAERFMKAVESVAEFVSTLAYYSASQFTDPSNCASFFELDEHGGGVRYRSRTPHNRFLFDLYSAFRKKSSSYEQYMSIVGKGGVKLISTLRFEEKRISSPEVEVRAGGKFSRKPKKRYIIIPHFGVDEANLSANQLSEGTFRTLAILFYLISDKSKLVLVEEPEVCVHHGLLATVVELIKTISSEKQVIVTTHSDFVLEYLEPEDVFMVRRYKDRGTKVAHIPAVLSKNRYEALRDYLRQEGNLGEYWRHGDLEDV